MGVKAAGAQGSQLYHLHVLIVMKSEHINFLEPSGPFEACNGTALLLLLPVRNSQSLTDGVNVKRF
jgi:hypothetical protein